MNSNVSPQMAKGSGSPAESKFGKLRITERIKERRRPSRSSRLTLQYRAIESLRPPDEQVCFDTLAGEFMGAAWMRLARNRIVRKLMIRRSDKDAIGMWGFVVARTRYMDDFLKDQIQEGIEQLVILGAGYDSRAYRFKLLPEKVRVFEVDHPDTQRLKMEAVLKILGSLPKNVTYVHVDFTTEKLEVNLPKNGYDRALKTLFIWEGVMGYLKAEAVDRTLAFIAGSSGPGSCVVFDYLLGSALDGTSGSSAAEKLRKDCARMGEPLLFGIKDNAVGEFLLRRGFSLLQNVNSSLLKDAYFKGKGQRREVFPLEAIASARVQKQR
jgi:methyltransferase (TIGR00027 family)